MTTETPADAVREALDRLAENIYDKECPAYRRIEIIRQHIAALTEQLTFLSFIHNTQGILQLRDERDAALARLAALAGAAPVACDLVDETGSVVAGRAAIEYADGLLRDYYWQKLGCFKTNFLYTHAPAKAREDDARDARRYRWLRGQHWNTAAICVVASPKEAVKLGYDCPSGDRLDAAIDAALATFAEGE